MFILPHSVPIINSIPEHSNLLSIIQNDEKSYEWIYNNFVQLIYREFKWAKIASNPVLWPADYYEKCPFVNCIRLKRQSVDITKVIEFINMKLYENFYVIISVDGFYIPVSSNYRTCHMNHPMLIYGSDENIGVFLTSDFYKDGYYTNELINYNDFVSAFSSIEDKWTSVEEPYMDIILLRARRNVDYKFNYTFLFKQISDYSHSSNRSKLVTESWNLDKVPIYGLKVYDEIYIDLNRIGKIDAEIPNHFFAIPECQKKIMYMRLKYLENKNILDINNYRELQQEFKKIIKLNEKLKLLSLKYNLTYNREILEKIKYNIINMKNMENDWYYKFENKLIKNIL